MPDTIRPLPLGYAQVQVSWTVTGSPISPNVTFAVRNVGSMSPDDIADNVYLAGTFTNGPFDADSFNPSYTLKTIYVLSNFAGIMFSTVKDVTTVGTSAITATPSINTCIVVNKETLRAGRAFRGRMEWPVGYVSETNVSNLGEIGGTQQDDLQDMIGGYLAQLAARNVPMHLVHSGPSASPGSIPDPTPVTALNVRKQLGSARRRLKRISV